MELEFSSDIISLLFTTGFTIYCFGWVLLKLTQQVPITGQMTVYFKEMITKIIPTGQVIFCTGFCLQHHVTTIIKRKEAPTSDEIDHVFSLNLFLQHFKGGNKIYEQDKKLYAHHIKTI